MLIVPPIGLRSPGIEEFVHEIFVAASMKLIAAGLHCHVEQPAPRLPVFRGISAGLYSNLLDRVHAWSRHRLRRGIAVRRVLPIDPERLCIARRAVYPQVGISPKRAAAWQQLNHRVGVANARRPGGCTDAQRWKIVELAR